MGGEGRVGSPAAQDGVRLVKDYLSVGQCSSVLLPQGRYLPSIHLHANALPTRSISDRRRGADQKVDHRTRPGLVGNFLCVRVNGKSRQGHR